MRCVQHRRFRCGSTRNFHFVYQKFGLTTSKVNAKSGKFLGFWIHLASNILDFKQDIPSIWLTYWIYIIHPATSRFFRTKVAHSGHDHCGTRLAHAAMGYPAGSSHEVPQDLRRNHRRALKFRSNLGSRPAGT